LAANANQDPIAYRLSLLGNQPRFANVLKQVAEKSGWNTPAPAGRTRGVALMEGYDTYMAMVSEISVSNGEVKVHKVTTVADIGRMVNPDTCEAQIQSSIVFGLSAALAGNITLDKGRVQQTNFHDYPVMRMAETPLMETHLVASTEKPGGIGEPATAVVTAATANAVSKAIGKRVRALPMSREMLAKA
jgi:isoquinoline 1-oxidoreductase subunit beta